MKQSPQLNIACVLYTIFNVKFNSSLDSLPCANTASHNSKLATELRRAAISVNVAIILLVASFPGLQSQPVKLLRRMTTSGGVALSLNCSARMHGAISRALPPRWL